MFLFLCRQQPLFYLGLLLVLVLIYLVRRYLNGVSLKQQEKHAAVSAATSHREDEVRVDDHETDRLEAGLFRTGSLDAGQDQDEGEEVSIGSIDYHPHPVGYDSSDGDVGDSSIEIAVSAVTAVITVTAVISVKVTTVATAVKTCMCRAGAHFLLMSPLRIHCKA